MKKILFALALAVGTLGSVAPAYAGNYHHNRGWRHHHYHHHPVCRSWREHGHWVRRCR
ncbi:MAG TPA: hypothetical protein VGM52_00580 [Herbaspirillum sp.]